MLSYNDTPEHPGLNPATIAATESEREPHRDAVRAKKSLNMPLVEANKVKKYPRALRMAQISVPMHIGGIFYD